MNKKYQQKRNLKDDKPGTLCPELPEFQAGDPAPGAVVYRWFDPEGNYLGWCSYDDGRKFIYGKLYYKTKGQYQTKTKRSITTSNARMIRIVEKATGNLALYAACRVITEKDLIDLDDKVALIKSSRAAIQDFDMNHYNFSMYPNEHKLIPVTMQRKVENDMKEFLKSKKEEILGYLNTYEATLAEQRSDEVAIGVPIDI